MMVTEGGGAGSFGAAGGFGMAGGAAFCCCGGCGALGSACGEPASFCAQEVATADVAKATAIKMNWRLARIRPPELLDPSLALLCKSVRHDNRNLDLAACAQDFQRDLVAMAAHHEIDAGTAKLQIAHDHLVEERRQAWVTQTNFATLSIEFKPERRFEQRERRRACPGLRRAGHGIERRSASPFTPKAAE